MNKSDCNCDALRTFVALLLLVATGAITAATTLMRMSVAQISRTSHVIVRARCITNATIWDAGEIWTRTTFEIEDLWRGRAVPERIGVRLLGGSAGNITSSVSGIPHFQPGEEVVLFLEPAKRGDFSIVSWRQGTFRIHRNKRTGEEIVVQDTASLATYDPDYRRFEAAGIRGMALADFRSQVDAALSVRSPGK